MDSPVISPFAVPLTCDPAYKGPSLSRDQDDACQPAPPAHSDTWQSFRQGLGGSAGGFVSFGQVGPHAITTVGGRLESQRLLVGNDLARLSTVGGLQLGVGNALLIGGDLGLKGEFGPQDLHLYGVASGTANAGVAPGGLTAGLGVRTALGLQAGIVYGEVAREMATNLRSTSGSLGLRLHF